MTRVYNVLLSIVLLSTAVLTCHAAPSWRVIDVPGAQSTFACKINNVATNGNSGDIVGYYSMDGVSMHGFLLTGAGSLTTFDFPGASNTFALGINDFGQIVGKYNVGGGAYHGFLLEGGVFTVIDFPGAKATTASDINNAGQIVGSFTDHSGLNDSGFELSAGTFSNIHPPGTTGSAANGINNLGDIIGTAEHSAYLYRGGQFTRTIFIEFSTATFGSGLNDDREGVGYYLFPKGPSYDGYAYFHGQLKHVEYPQGLSTYARGINNTGDIVGYYVDYNRVTHGFVRRRGTN